MKTQRKSGRKQAAVEVVTPAAAPSGKRWWYVAGILALAYGDFQAYGSLRNGPFVFDDSFPLQSLKKTSANS
jgi:hypothetical protein